MDYIAVGILILLGLGGVLIVGAILILLGGAMALAKRQDINDND